VNLRATATAQQPADEPNALAAAVDAALAAGELDAAIAKLGAVPATDGDWMLYRAWLERQRGLYATSIATVDAHLVAAGASAPALLQRGYSGWLAGDLALAAADLDRAALQATDSALRARIDGERTALAAHRRELAGVAVDAQRVAMAGWITLAAVALALGWTLVSTLRAR